MRLILAHSGFRWAAVVILLAAYILVSQGYINGQGLVFNTMNSIGSVLLIANSLSMRPRDWAVAVFNMVWLAIAFVTIIAVIV